MTDAVLEEARAWQNRPLESRSIPLVFFDALRVKIRDDGLVRNKAVYLAWACSSTAPGYSGALDRAERGRQVLAKVMTELKNRGVQDILIAVIDGLKGFPEAISAVFPQTLSRPASCI